MRLTTLVLVSCLALDPSADRAGDALDLPSLVAFASEHSSVVQDRAKAVETARGALVSARILFPSNPQLVYGRVTDRFNARQGEGGRSIEIEQELEPWGQRGRRMAEAQAAYDASQHDLDATRLEISLAVTRGFLRILILNDKLKLLDDVRTLSDQVQQAAEAKRGSGLISDVAFQIILFESLGLENDAGAARAVRDSALADLRRLVGISAIDADQMGGVPEFTPVNVDEVALSRQALDRPDLLALRQMIASAQAGISRLKRERLPEVRLRLGQSRERSVFAAADFRYLSGVTPSVDRLQDSDRLLTFGAAISLPVFRRNQGELLAASSEADRLTIRLRSAESQIGTDVRRHLDRIRGRGAILR